MSDSERSPSVPAVPAFNLYQYGLSPVPTFTRKMQYAANDAVHNLLSKEKCVTLVPEGERTGLNGFYRAFEFYSKERGLALFNFIEFLLLEQFQKIIAHLRARIDTDSFTERVFFAQFAVLLRSMIQEEAVQGYTFWRNVFRNAGLLGSVELDELNNEKIVQGLLTVAKCIQQTMKYYRATFTKDLRNVTSDVFRALYPYGLLVFVVSLRLKRRVTLLTPDIKIVTKKFRVMPGADRIQKSVVRMYNLSIPKVHVPQRYREAMQIAWHSFYKKVREKPGYSTESLDLLYKENDSAYEMPVAAELIKGDFFKGDVLLVMMPDIRNSPSVVDITFNNVAFLPVLQMENAEDVEILSFGDLGMAQRDFYGKRYATPNLLRFSSTTLRKLVPKSFGYKETTVYPTFGRFLRMHGSFVVSSGFPGTVLPQSHSLPLLNNHLLLKHGVIAAEGATLQHDLVDLLVPLYRGAGSQNMWNSALARNFFQRAKTAATLLDSKNLSSKQKNAVRALLYQISISNDVFSLNIFRSTVEDISIFLSLLASLISASLEKRVVIDLYAVVGKQHVLRRIGRGFPAAHFDADVEPDRTLNDATAPNYTFVSILAVPVKWRDNPNALASSFHPLLPPDKGQMNLMSVEAPPLTLDQDLQDHVSAVYQNSGPFLFNDRCFIETRQRSGVNTRACSIHNSSVLIYAAAFRKDRSGLQKVNRMMKQGLVQFESSAAYETLVFQPARYFIHMLVKSAKRARRMLMRGSSEKRMRDIILNVKYDFEQTLDDAENATQSEMGFSRTGVVDEVIAESIFEQFSSRLENFLISLEDVMEVLIDFLESIAPEFATLGPRFLGVICGLWSLIDWDSETDAVREYWRRPYRVDLVRLQSVRGYTSTVPYDVQEKFFLLNGQPGDEMSFVYLSEAPLRPIPVQKSSFDLLENIENNISDAIPEAQQRRPIVDMARSRTEAGSSRNPILIDLSSDEESDFVSELPEVDGDDNGTVAGGQMEEQFDADEASDALGEVSVFEKTQSIERVIQEETGQDGASVVDQDREGFYAIIYSEKDEEEEDAPAVQVAKKRRIAPVLVERGQASSSEVQGVKRAEILHRESANQEREAQNQAKDKIPLGLQNRPGQFSFLGILLNASVQAYRAGSRKLWLSTFHRACETALLKIKDVQLQTELRERYLAEGLHNMKFKENQFAPPVFEKSEQMDFSNRNRININEDERILFLFSFQYLDQLLHWSEYTKDLTWRSKPGRQRSQLLNSNMKQLLETYGIRVVPLTSASIVKKVRRVPLHALVLSAYTDLRAIQPTSMASGQNSDRPIEVQQDSTTSTVVQAVQAKPADVISVVQNEQDSAMQKVLRMLDKSLKSRLFNADDVEWIMRATSSKAMRQSLRTFMLNEKDLGEIDREFNRHSYRMKLSFRTPPRNLLKQAFEVPDKVFFPPEVVFLLPMTVRSVLKIKEKSLSETAFNTEYGKQTYKIYEFQNGRMVEKNVSLGALSANERETPFYPHLGANGMYNYVSYGGRLMSLRDIMLIFKAYTIGHQGIQVTQEEIEFLHRMERDNDLPFRWEDRQEPSAEATQNRMRLIWVGEFRQMRNRILFLNKSKDIPRHTLKALHDLAQAYWCHIKLVMHYVYTRFMGRSAREAQIEEFNYSKDALMTDSDMEKYTQIEVGGKTSVLSGHRIFKYYSTSYDNVMNEKEKQSFEKNQPLSEDAEYRRRHTLPMLASHPDVKHTLQFYPSSIICFKQYFFKYLNFEVKLYLASLNNSTWMQKQNSFTRYDFAMLKLDQKEIDDVYDMMWKKLVRIALLPKPVWTQINSVYEMFAPCPVCPSYADVRALMDDHGVFDDYSLFDKKPRENGALWQNMTTEDFPEIKDFDNTKALAEEVLRKRCAQGKRMQEANIRVLSRLPPPNDPKEERVVFQLQDLYQTIMRIHPTVVVQPAVPAFDSIRVAHTGSMLKTFGLYTTQRVQKNTLLNQYTGLVRFDKSPVPLQASSAEFDHSFEMAVTEFLGNAERSFSWPIIGECQKTLRQKKIVVKSAEEREAYIEKREQQVKSWEKNRDPIQESLYDNMGKSNDDSLTPKDRAKARKMVENLKDVLSTYEDRIDTLKKEVEELKSNPTLRTFVWIEGNPELGTTDKIVGTMTFDANHLGTEARFANHTPNIVEDDTQKAPRSVRKFLKLYGANSLANLYTLSNWINFANLQNMNQIEYQPRKEGIQADKLKRPVDDEQEELDLSDLSDSDFGEEDSDYRDDTEDDEQDSFQEDFSEQTAIEYHARLSALALGMCEPISKKVTLVGGMLGKISMVERDEDTDQNMTLSADLIESITNLVIFHTRMTVDSKHELCIDYGEDYESFSPESFIPPLHGLPDQTVYFKDQ